MIFPLPDFSGRAVSKSEAAKLIGVHPRTLTNWHVRAYGPRAVVVGGAPIYDLSQVETFLAGWVGAK